MLELVLSLFLTSAAIQQPHPCDVDTPSTQQSLANVIVTLAFCQPESRAPDGSIVPVEGFVLKWNSNVIDLAIGAAPAAGVVAAFGPKSASGAQEYRTTMFFAPGEHTLELTAFNTVNGQRQLSSPPTVIIVVASETPPPPPPPPPPGQTVTDPSGGVWTFGANRETLRDGVWMGGGNGWEYRLVSGSVYVLGDDKVNWWRWDGSIWVFHGPQAPVDGQPPPPPPPVDCVVSEFGEWSPWAKVSEKTMSRTRSRTIVTPPANGGAGCPSLTETQTLPIPPEDCATPIDDDLDGQINEGCAPPPCSLVLSRIAWPSANSGRRTLTFQASEPWSQFEFTWPNVLSVTAVRGCVTTVTR